MKPISMFLAGMVLCCALLGAGHAAELRPLAVRAMELSGTRETLDGLRKSLDGQVADDPRTKKLNKKQRAELTRILSDALDGRKMAEELTAALVATQDEARLAQAVAIMDNAVFQRVTRLSMQESDGATPKAMADFVKALEKQPPDGARVRLLQRLDVATDGAAILADISYTSAAQFLEAAPISAQERAEQLAQLRARLDAASPNEFLVRGLYSARKVELKDLEAYVAAHEQEAMGWLARHLGYNLRDLMETNMGRMVAAIEAAAAKKP